MKSKDLVYDNVIIGNNYFSYLLGFIYVAKGETVVIIKNDESIDNNRWGQFLGTAEINFLKMWGELNNIKAIKNIDRYLIPCHLRLILDDTHILMGPGPKSNLCELIRKRPELFEDIQLPHVHKSFLDKFEKSFEHFVKRICETALKYRTIQTFDESIFNEGASQEFKRVLQAFKGKGAFNNESTDEALRIFKKIFIFSLQSIFHSRLIDTANDFEMYSLFISLFSHYYTLDEKKLLSDIRKEFELHGGKVFDTSIKDWKMRKGKVEEIKTDDGKIILPGQIAYNKELSYELPFAIFTPNKRFFKSVAIAVNMKGPTFQYVPNEKLFFASTQRMGNMDGFWQADFVNDKKMIVYFVMEDRPGTQAKFYFEKLKEVIDKDFTQVFPKYDFSRVESMRIINSKEFWNGGVKKKRNFLYSTRTNLLKFQEYTTPNAGKKIKNLSYWGPLNDYPLGLFSYYMEIKNQFTY